MFYLVLRDSFKDRPGSIHLLHFTETQAWKLPRELQLELKTQQPLLRASHCYLPALHQAWEASRETDTIMQLNVAKQNQQDFFALFLPVFSQNTTVQVCLCVVFALAWKLSLKRSDWGFLDCLPYRTKDNAISSQLLLKAWTLPSKTCFMDLPVNVHTVHGLTYSQWNEEKREREKTTNKLF